MERDREYADDDLVPVTVAARMVGVSRETMRKYGDDGLVPVRRTPTNHRRFRVGDLRNLPAPRKGEHTGEEVDDPDPEVPAQRSPSATHLAAGAA